MSRLTYILHDGEFVKIGSSDSVEGCVLRVQACQTGNPRQISLIGVSCTPEKELHARFASDRVRGEWFRVSTDILQFIASSEFSGVNKYKAKGDRKWKYVKDYFRLVETESESVQN